MAGGPLPSWKLKGNCVVYEGETFIYGWRYKDDKRRYSVMTVTPDLFFPERGGSAAPAKRVCSTCPVKDKCLQYAVDAVEILDGVWGGTTVHERRPLRRKRKKAA